MKTKSLFVLVGSQNPVKIEAVKKGFSAYFQAIKVSGVKVKSDINIQPLSFEEAYQGALNRAKNALTLYPKANYAVGLEGTLQQYSFGWTTGGLVVILNRAGIIGISISPQLLIPHHLINRVKNTELGKIIDEVSGQTNLKQKGGAFGFFTKGKLTRQQAYSQAVIFALSKFINKKLYEDK